MPQVKRTATVFYARDKLPFEESDNLRQSIEDDEPLVKIVSDVMDVERNSEDSVTPPLDDQASITFGAKRPLSPDEEVLEETPKKPGRPAKRQRRTEVKEAVTPRRSARLCSVASSANEEKRTPTPAPTKRGRGRPPTKKKGTVVVQVPEVSPSTKRSSARLLAKSKKSDESDTEPETEWEVEKIVDSGIDGPTGVHLYLVKWKGFSMKECTWEPKKNLGNCHKLIREFEERH
ncbi:unnamed protein product [Fusarium equiseti]|uniref:Chromo domain-containing protein n=1 Tax=Fusarium equiseti TaxID=61235 RepID=A0A8J2IJ47_FUSEQ|nr:unnamed protein product [Fusarium equiseti]